MNDAMKKQHQFFIKPFVCSKNLRMISKRGSIMVSMIAWKESLSKDLGYIGLGRPILLVTSLNCLQHLKESAGQRWEQVGIFDLSPGA